MHRTTTMAISAAMALGLALTGCGDDDGTSAGASGDRPTVAVTTNILGDVVTNLVGDAADVVVIMPAGSDPHDFEASAQQVQQMSTADALITNGADFETNLGGAIETAESDGVPTYHAIDGVETIDFAEAGGHAHEEGDDHAEGEADDHADEEAPETGSGADEGEESHTDEGEESHADEGEEGHDHEGEDPHFFTDPARMADAAQGIVDFLADEVPSLAADDVQQDAGVYIEELRDLDASVEDTLSAVPDDERILITNHEVFGYFADRFGFEVVGVVIPGGTTGGEPSAANLAELAEVVEHEGVPAIFADTSSPTQLADTLASEVGGDVEVVELFTESLGDEGSGGETYLEMITTNAQRIADALT